MKLITKEDLNQLKVDLVEVRPDAQRLIETILEQTYDSLSAPSDVTQYLAENAELHAKLAECRGRYETVKLPARNV